MDYGRFTENLMGMDDRVWHRHANRWSVYTRIATGFIVFWAFWSYVWLGWWALVPIAVLMAWLWVNPRLFAPPKNIDHWTAKGVYGERVWLERKKTLLPAGFAFVANLTSGFAGLGSLLFVYGLIVQDFWAGFMGWHFALVCKLWFIDRMIWLWDVTPDKNDRLIRWGVIGDALV